MPLSRVVTALVWLILVAKQLLSGKRADGAHLGVRDTKFVCVVENRVNMKCRIGWLSSQLA
jgi:hypothetical protein